MGSDGQVWHRWNLCDQAMTDENDIKMAFTLGGLFVILIALIIGGIELHKFQETEEMKSCVSAGKVWKVENVDSVNERVCVNP